MITTNGEAITLLEKAMEGKLHHATWLATQAANHEELAAEYRQRESDAREQAAALRRAREFL